MFGNGKGIGGSPGNSNKASGSNIDYLALANAACETGDLDQAAHLYLLAFEHASKQEGGPGKDDIDSLRKAWDAACELKDRSLAEHVFEKLEPYCSSDEVAQCTERLQRLALERLEEFGLSREDLQEMAEMVAADFAEGTTLLQVAPRSIHAHSVSLDANDLVVDNDELGDDLAASESSKKPKPGTPGGNGITFTYKDLVGYKHAIDNMRVRGVGMGVDPRFSEFLTMLKRRHGIESLPSFETMLFRSYSREDASKFMAATVGEMGLPTIRMYMEETPNGYPLLCVAASPNIKLNGMARSSFDGPGVLVLEDIDSWGPPLGAFEDADPFTFAQLSRGVREAMMFVRTSVENPDITVMASCALDAQLDDFFLNLLDPIAVIDIDVPDEDERADVWKHAATLFPSLRFIDRGDLVRLSKNMSREDIYLAARESVEQAYRQSVEKRSFVPVTRDNIFDKVAAYQPLDSEEYHELEDMVVGSWRIALDNLDDIIEKEED